MGTSYLWWASARLSDSQNGLNIAPHNILVIKVIFLQCFIINVSRSFGWISLKPTWIQYTRVFLKLCASPWDGVAPSVFLWEGTELNTAPQSIFTFEVIIFFVINSSKQKVKFTSRWHQLHESGRLRSLLRPCEVWLQSTRYHYTQLINYAFLNVLYWHISNTS